MDKLVKLHKKGNTNREIARILGMSHSGIAYQLKKLGLAANGKARQTLIVTVDGKGICNKCKIPKELECFRVQRSNAKYPYRLTYCDKCRQQQQYDNLNSDVKLYLNDRLRRLKVRSKILGIKFTLTRDQLYKLWNKQQGKCFYTDVNLRCKVGEGYDRNAFSIDKIDPTKGYTYKNVVLCTTKVNTCKSDLTLEELKDWMPNWYKRLDRLK